MLGDGAECKPSWLINAGFDSASSQRCLISKPKSDIKRNGGRLASVGIRHSTRLPNGQQIPLVIQSWGCWIFSLLIQRSSILGHRRTLPLPTTLRRQPRTQGTRLSPCLENQVGWFGDITRHRGDLQLRWRTRPPFPPPKFCAWHSQHSPLERHEHLELHPVQLIPKK